MRIASIYFIFEYIPFSSYHLDLGHMFPLRETQLGQLVIVDERERRLRMTHHDSNKHTDRYGERPDVSILRPTNLREVRPVDPCDDDIPAVSVLDLARVGERHRHRRRRACPASLVARPACIMKIQLSLLLMLVVGFRVGSNGTPQASCCNELVNCRDASTRASASASHGALGLPLRIWKSVRLPLEQDSQHLSESSQTSLWIPKKSETEQEWNLVLDLLEPETRQVALRAVPLSELWILPLSLLVNPLLRAPLHMP